jgi:hypothetical protein
LAKVEFKVVKAMARQIVETRRDFILILSFGGFGIVKVKPAF